jgi:hypothetical protein
MAKSRHYFLSALGNFTHTMCTSAKVNEQEYAGVFD